MNVFDLTAGNELIKLQKVTGLNPSAEFQSYSVEGLIPETNQYAFNLVAFNTCNKESQSNSLTTIFLRGSFDSNTATLNWNQNNSNVNLQNILIDRDGTFEKLITLSAERQTHNHVWPDTDASNCYIVSDSGQVMSPQGVLRNFVQRSNVTCIFRSLRIYIPTAFAPSGVNRLFIPYFSSTSLLKQYQLDIYDRWGGKIFSSDNYLLGWNGYTKDKLLPSDLYTYVLEIVTIADEKVLRKGEVFLVR
jgi:gliding motility-associated-like protein